MQRFAALLCCAALVSMPALAKGRKRRQAPPPPLVIAPGAQAGEWVPASAPLALLIDGLSAEDKSARPTEELSTTGIRALLAVAARSAPSLDPGLVAQDLSRAVGVDPLTAGAESGLSLDGPRVLIGDERASGFSAPVADEARAKAALDHWLSQLGNPKAARSGPLRGVLVSGGGSEVRAGMVAKVAGSARFLSASGRDAASLVAELSRLGRARQDVEPLGAIATISAALLAVPGPVRLWARGQAPLLGAVISVQATAMGLEARGLVLPAAGSAALLEGTAPPDTACAGEPLFCLRAAPGPGLRELAPMMARALIGRELLGGQGGAIDALVQSSLTAASGPLLLRIEGIEGSALADPKHLLAAMPSSIASGAQAAIALPAGLTALPPPRVGATLSQNPPLCVQTQPGAIWLSSPCSPLPAHFADPGGGLELVARFDTKALSRALAPLSALDALRGPIAAGAFAAKLLWGDLLASSGPVEVWAKPTAQTAPQLAGALDLSLSWPLSTGGYAK